MKFIEQRKIEDEYEIFRKKFKCTGADLLKVSYYDTPSNPSECASISDPNTFDNKIITCTANNEWYITIGGSPKKLLGIFCKKVSGNLTNNANNNKEKFISFDPMIIHNNDTVPDKSLEYSEKVR